jgi:hypothetical protein
VTSSYSVLVLTSDGPRAHWQNPRTGRTHCGDRPQGRVAWAENPRDVTCPDCRLLLHLCVKRAYQSRAEALEALEALRGGERPLNVRSAYRCDRPECKGAWHLTSQPRRPRQGRRVRKQ